LIGTVLLVAAIDRDNSLTVIGALFVVASMVTYAGGLLVHEIRSVNRPADDAFSEGYEAGYDRGWRDGSDHARPPLVGLVGGAKAGVKVADSCDTEPQRGAGRASNL
jgi:hypothetical protein